MRRSSASFFSLSFRIRSRRGMELAINTLVVMILGILLLGTGIYFLSKILLAGSTLPSSLSDAQMSEIARAFSQGQQVAVAPASQRSPNADPVVFGVGIKNTFAQPRNFSVEIGYPALNPGSASVRASWFMQNMKMITLVPGAQQREVVIVGQKKDTPPIPAGKYTFIVTVKYADDAGVLQPYENRFFTVVVE